jgi:GxxExxY protein
MDENEIGTLTIGAAIRVHQALGPGLLESAYEACLVHELLKNRLSVRRQVLLPVYYDGVEVDSGFRLDVLVNEKVVLELKAVDRLTDVHIAQLLSYLKLGNFRLGYLLNFNVPRMRSGIKRIVNGMP